MIDKLQKFLDWTSVNGKSYLPIPGGVIDSGKGKLGGRLQRFRIFPGAREILGVVCFKSDYMPAYEFLPMYAKDGNVFDIPPPRPALPGEPFSYIVVGRELWKDLLKKERADAGVPPKIKIGNHSKNYP